MKMAGMILVLVLVLGVMSPVAGKGESPEVPGKDPGKGGIPEKVLDGKIPKKICLGCHKTMPIPGRP